ncbi:MAG: hypothetical protein AAFS10_03235 [Myxococcota bacterium]
MNRLVVVQFTLMCAVFISCASGSDRVQRTVVTSSDSDRADASDEEGAEDVPSAARAVALKAEAEKRMKVVGLLGARTSDKSEINTLSLETHYEQLEAVLSASTGVAVGGTLDGSPQGGGSGAAGQGLGTSPKRASPKRKPTLKIHAIRVKGPLDPDEARRTVRARQHAMLSCLERSLTPSSAAGHYPAEVSMTVNSEGRVQKVQFTAGSWDNSAKDCVMGALKQQRFKKPNVSGQTTLELHAMFHVPKLP